MGRKWTPEERKAASERAKAAIKAAQQTPPVMEANAEVEELRKQIEELKILTNAALIKPGNPQGGAQLGMVGTITKFTVDPKSYPDPRERLSDEPRLKRYAFRDNFDLEWDVSSISYQTKDGLNIREPKFSLNLIGRVFDEDTGEPTSQRFTVCKSIFFEDPQAAIAIANENGLPVDEDNEKWFLDEMRYLRMRDWLMEAFYPPKPVQPKQNKREVVIGNKLVETWEINSEDSETMPFGGLKTKL